MVLLSSFKRLCQSRHFIVSRVGGMDLGNALLGGPCNFSRLVGIVSLHPMHLVTHPLLFPLVRIMGVGIVRVLYRAGRPTLGGLKLSLHPLKLLRKYPAQ